MNREPTNLALPPAMPADVTTSVGIFAPRGRDAAVAQQLFAAEGIATVVVPSVGALTALVERRIGAVLVTEEAMTGPDMPTLREAILAQPAWSDLPFIVLSNGASGHRSDIARTRMDVLSNAVLLSRPLHVEELLRSVRSALTARVRQHEARARMEELQLRERQLQESEAKFHAIADSVDQMIWSTMPDGFHDYFNRRWYEFTGVADGSTDGAAWSGVFHPEDHERTWEVWRSCITTGKPYEIEYRLRHRSGAYRWVLGRAQPVRDADGTILRWYGTCTDIDDEVRARAATVDGLTRQRDMVWNTAVDLIAVAETDGTLLSVNKAWTRILGWPVDSLIGERFLDWTHPKDMERTAAKYATIPETSLVEPYEFRLRHADGSYRWFTWTASAEEGRIYTIGRDVTERRVRAGVLAATEAALRQSQKLEMIGQLTGGVAHDFNNLLMAIRSSLDLVRRRMSNIDERTLSYIDNASKATERGAALTQRMLAFARRQDLHAEAVDVATVVPGLRDLLERSLGPQISIVMEIAADVPRATVDLNQLEMAILNLAVNGRDAMDGDGRLTIRVDETDGRDIPDLDEGAYVRIAVSDTGDGMDAATLAQATEPFFTTKGVGKGTGLGLSMIHGLARQSRGTFLLESAPGAGTTAALYLPVDTTETPEASPPGSRIESVAAVAPPDDQPARWTILAVDDDVLVSMGTVGILEDLGHEVIEAHSGTEALAALDSRSDIDLIITDQAMPGMTGIEFARQVRERRPNIPIVLATGYAEMPDGGEALITARLEKPFSDATLQKLLAKL